MRALLAGWSIQHAARHQRLVGDEADRPAIEPGEARHDIAREGRLLLVDAAFVGDQFDNSPHVVASPGVGRHDIQQRLRRKLGASSIETVRGLGYRIS